MLAEHEMQLLDVRDFVRILCFFDENFIKEGEKTIHFYIDTV